MRKHLHILILFTLICLFSSGCKSDRSVAHRQESGNYANAENNYIYDYDMITEDVMDMAYESEEPAMAYSKAVPAAAANTAEEQTQKRMVQKTASINIQVMEPQDAAEKVITMTEQMGGFVVSSTSGQEYYSSDIYLPYANLTIRIPADHLNEMLTFIENLTGDTSKYVSNKRIFGKDITSEYVDAKSRLKSLEKTRDKLYEIMETAENAEEALDVYNRIAEAESDIEVYKGQIKYMEESTALSSIDIQIKSVRPAPIHTVQKWSIGEVFSDAFENLLSIGKSIIEVLINFIVVVLPILIMIALPVALFVFIIKKIIKKNSSDGGNTASDDQNEDKLTEVKKN